MKNRKREICTSGSVRDEDGQPPHLLGRRTISASGRGRCRAAGGVARRMGANLSGEAGAFDHRLCPRRRAPTSSARLIGQWLSERLGQQFVIENRPGAGSNIATEAVVQVAARRLHTPPGRSSQRDQRYAL